MPSLLVSEVVGVAVGVPLSEVVVGGKVSDVETLPGPFVCALFFIVGSPLAWTKNKVVVLDGCFDGSIIINGGALTFGLLGSGLVLVVGSCEPSC